jgi:hypothetical protein
MIPVAYELGGHFFPCEHGTDQTGRSMRHWRHPVEQVSRVSGAGLNRRDGRIEVGTGMSE